MLRARLSAALLAALLVLALPAGVAAAGDAPSPPDRLAARFADALAALARRDGATTVRVDVAADPEFEGAPAVAALRAAIEADLRGAATIAPDGAAADLAIQARLARI